MTIHGRTLSVGYPLVGPVTADATEVADEDGCVWYSMGVTC